jgi:hypothetical protein
MGSSQTEEIEAIIVMATLKPAGTIIPTGFFCAGQKHMIF